ncbi:MAG TPA: type II toxin-antitoxin system RelE/ParE family toxin [Acidobacteriota bacterium]|nr:type II toxin-antitoxin system RelE/ParE family toxin [Acidobacteriota bacterium]
MYAVVFRDSVSKILKKLYKRDRAIYFQIMSKVEEISLSPEHYKNLRYGMKDYKRVHIGHYVLLFSIEENTVIIEDFDHHDVIYDQSTGQPH